jgi:DNA-binding CsgD family transcriptional regulator
VEALTPQELRVARLAAAGRTNREIAVELYVTLKTVEGHLARAYAKLGIDGRRDLVRALGE